MYELKAPATVPEQSLLKGPVFSEAETTSVGSIRLSINEAKARHGMRFSGGMIETYAGSCKYLLYIIGKTIRAVLHFGMKKYAFFYILYTKPHHPRSGPGC